MSGLMRENSGKLMFMIIELLFGMMRNWRRDSDDCTTMLMLLNCTLKMVKIVHFMLWVLDHNREKKYV